MSTTPLTLGEHWDDFIAREVASGRYASASEVIRAALRELEEREQRLTALRRHLAEGADAAARGEFVETSSPAELVKRAQSRTRK